MKGEKMYSNAKGFNYNNKSLKDVLSGIVIGYMDTPEESFGLEREIVGGSNTVNPKISPAYNTKYTETLEFTISLIHQNGNLFTYNEISKLTQWLTSPKSYRKLQFYDCDNNNFDIVYYAIATNITPNIAGGMAGITITFKCNASYGFKEKSQAIDITNVLDYPDHKTSLALNCESDELESYVYPMLMFEVPTLWSNIKIKNMSDQNKIMDLYDMEGNYTFDCQHQVIHSDEGDILLSDLFKMDELQTLYWLRLVPGINNIEITGRCKLTIKWLEPKKVGSF